MSWAGCAVLRKLDGDVQVLRLILIVDDDTQGQFAAAIA